jgi:hypothetical protein
MLTLAAADTLAGVASSATIVTSTVFGMELNAGTEVYKVLDQRQLAAAAGTIYTVPASTTAFIKSIHVVNNDSVTRTFQYFRGGTAAVNAITPVITLPIGGMAIYEDGGGWTVYDSTGKSLTQAQVISSATPTTVDTAAGSAGTSLQVSAADHDHQLSVATNAILLSSSAAPGAAATTLRSNDTIAAFDATAPTIDTPAVASAVGVINFAARRDHAHQSPGGVSRIISDVAIANTETVVVAFNSIPTAILNIAGVTFRVMVAGTLTTGATPGSGIFRIRIGPTTLTGVIPATITLAQTGSVTTAPFAITGMVTVRATGATGTLLGNLWVDAQNGAAPIAFTIAAAGFVSATTGTVTADLTLSTNRLEFTYISGNAGSTATFRTASWELYQMT